MAKDSLVAYKVDRRLGVLEASWRVGGASPAEVLALRELWREPALEAVCVSTVERYGDDLEAPSAAVVRHI